MSTKALFVMGLIFIMVAGFFYVSNDASLTRLNLKPSDIDYQAKNVEALQTDNQGDISYRLMASNVTHYQNAKVAVLDDPNILWRPNLAREVNLTANHAKLDEAQQIVTLAGQVTMHSKPLSSTDTAQSMTLTGQDFVGDMKNKQVTSQHPVNITQGNNRFQAQDLNANMATGDYAFNRVEMTFAPNP